MLAGHSGVSMRIRQAGSNAWTSKKARMPSAASGYCGASGDPANAMRATALVASSQRPPCDVASRRNADIAAYRGLLMKAIGGGSKAADVTANAFRHASAIAEPG